MHLLPLMNLKTQHYSKNAPFWDEAQQHFLAESLAQDGDWSEVIDELDVRIRQRK